MKKKFFLSALLISLFGLAPAKPVQADTSVVDIQKRGGQSSTQGCFLQGMWFGRKPQQLGSRSLP